MNRFVDLLVAPGLGVVGPVADVRLVEDPNGDFDGDAPGDGQGAHRGEARLGLMDVPGEAALPGLRRRPGEQIGRAQDQVGMSEHVSLQVGARRRLVGSRNVPEDRGMRTGQIHILWIEGEHAYGHWPDIDRAERAGCDRGRSAALAG